MNIVRFIKDWTLPVSMGIGAAAYLLFAFMPQLDAAGTQMAPFFAAILPLFMFLVLFVTFCKVDFRKLHPVAWHAWVALFQLLFIGVLMAFLLFPQSSIHYSPSTIHASLGISTASVVSLNLSKERYSRP